MSPKRSLTPSKVLSKLKRAFRKELGATGRTASDLLKSARLFDKAYELSCLIETIRSLKGHIPGSTFSLVNGTKVTFRGKGGPIDRRAWPHIDMQVGGRVIAELWVDIECLALSAWEQGKTVTGIPYGRAHELDVVLVERGASGRPRPDQLHVGVEAKHRKFNKGLLKELLGVRRETAFKSGLQPSPFAWWSAGGLPADPPCGLLLYCSETNVGKYVDPADFWGIHMEYHPC